MGDIVIKCPLTLKTVPTGLRAEWVVLDSLPAVAIPLRCAACGQIHKWKRDDAWICSPAIVSEEGATAL